MGAAYFYQLQRPLDAALPPLLTRALAQGWRVAVRGTDADDLRALDDALWLNPADGFVPHGIEGGERDAAQPVLLTLGEGANAPDCVMAVGGARIAPDEVARLSRACVIFGEAELAIARAQWREITAAGHAAQYWAEEDGRWEKKAEAG